MPERPQITAEITKLKEMKPRVRHFSGFGDDHHAAIDAQVRVLEQGLSEDDVYTEFEDGAENVLDAACTAAQWLAGEELDIETPSEEWECLLT